MRPRIPFVNMHEEGAANENVSMQSSFGNVSILSGWTPTTEQQPNGAGVVQTRRAPCLDALPAPARGPATPTSQVPGLGFSPSLRPSGHPPQGRPPAPASA